VAGQIVHQRLRPLGLDVEDEQLVDALGEQGVGHGAAGAASAQLHYQPLGHVRQAAAKAFGEAQAVGVVAHGAAVGQHHGIHRADAARLGGEVVEQWDDRLLAGKGDVEAGEAGALGGLQQFGQGVGGEAEHVQVDQAIEVSEALGVAFAFVHGGRQRSLDAGADEAGENGFGCGHDVSFPGGR